LVAAGKVLVAATKILFGVPNFVAVTTPFFFHAVKTEPIPSLINRAVEYNL